MNGFEVCPNTAVNNFSTPQLMNRIHTYPIYRALGMQIPILVFCYPNLVGYDCGLWGCRIFE